ncbi:pyridoxamine 5'-phosphate oxidase family protein [Streptomyces sp. NPDC090306]|uniref:pyridoxamine 5'-phosphate oxidase family protein n=1 Tax=Streptomyces sp. NPDC090306 TaxID=3365961 RepID=UPI00381EE981
MYGNDGFRELAPPDCLRLLARVSVGRVVYTRGALPAVLPVGFGVDRDGAVLLRTSATSELVVAIDGVVVAFEADEIDAADHSGWSVVVTGRATVVRDATERERPARTGPASGAPRPREVLVRIEPELVTGCQLVGGKGALGVERPT